MKILLIGGKGRLGSRLLADLKLANLDVVVFEGDATSYEELKKHSSGVTVIASTVGAKTVEDLVKISENLIKLAEEIGARIVWSGGAATLIDKDGNRFYDVPLKDFPAEMKDWIPAVYGHGKVLEIFKASTVKNSFMSPALNFVDQDSITGEYKSEATDKALYNNNDESFATYDSGAKALAEEIKSPKYIGKRFTIIENN